MNIYDVLTSFLEELIRPALTDYDLGLIITWFYLTNEFRGEKIKGIFREFPTYRDFIKIKDNLEEDRVVIQQPYYNLILNKKDYNPLEILCLSDPFLYLSHFTAMSFHGLIKRIPRTLYASSPDPKKWRELANQKMMKDYGIFYQKFIKSELPRLTNPAIKRIDKYSVNTFSSVHMDSFQFLSDSAIRVSTIGRTFFDMIREPKLCGGMQKVIRIYKKFGTKYKDCILDEISLNGNKIDKVRAGFILESICGIKEKRIENWLCCVERGGSRKLDPSIEYKPKYSERWCLSVNVDI